jgi:hypothetical protein
MAIHSHSFFAITANVFAYEQWRSPKRKLVQVHEQLFEAQTLTPPKARHCLYAVLGPVYYSVIIISLFIVI